MTPSAGEALPFPAWWSDEMAQDEDGKWWPSEEVLEMVHDGKRKTVKGAQDKGWKDEWVTFANAIREGGKPPIPYEQLVGVTKASFAAVESLRQKGKQQEI